ncbi:HdeD family acid-resistance protein [Patescibacteria group bacterium]|nr:HdeD family acid-resistance protein [Patescibacteria group bacterium]
MEKELLAQYSWVMWLRGLVAIIFGVIALFWPDVTVIVLLYVFAFYVLIDGLLSLLASIGAAKKHERWWIFIINGLISIAAGFIALFWPTITLLLLVYLIAAWALISGIFEIIAAVSIEFTKGSKWFLGIAGALSIILGILVFSFPLSGLFAIVWLIGIFALMYGVVLVGFGAKIHGLSKEN